MEIKEPSHDSTPKQEAAGEEYKQEAEQFLKLHRQNEVLAPSGLFSAYLVFVGAVTGVGVLASYTHHETTANVFLFICIALLLIAIIGALWYLIATFRKKSRDKADLKQGLLSRVYQTPFVAFLLRIANSPIARVCLYLLYIVLIGLYIRSFPRSPRVSLAFIAVCIFFLVYLAISDVAGFIRKEHEKDTLMLAKGVIALYDEITRINVGVVHLNSITDKTLKYLDETATSDSEIHKNLITAIENTNASVNELRSLEAKLPDLPVESKQLDAAPTAPDDGTP